MKYAYCETNKRVIKIMNGKKLLEVNVRWALYNQTPNLELYTNFKIVTIAVTLHRIYY